MITSSQIIPAALRELHEPSPYDLVGLLDSTREKLVDGFDPTTAVDILSDGLLWMRSLFPDGRWMDVIRVARAHPISGLLREDPLIRRAFAKPRGYPGDAPLIDLIYGDVSVASLYDTSPLGLALLERTLMSPTSAAIRECRHFMAALIDHIADVRLKPSVLAVACGHLREGHLSSAVRNAGLSRLVALDSDPESLAVVAQNFQHTELEIANRDVSSIVERVYPPSCFDLIYAAGLYDYLPTESATKLTEAFFDALKPGGRIVVTNPVENTYDAGFLEVFGDWFRTYRSASEMMDLASTIAPELLATKRVYTGLCPELYYLEIRRRFGPHR
jgi:extracellular factor (EF) 3-hydroxypalmitic acid methyl ester biosynthesis protein